MIKEEKVCNIIEKKCVADILISAIVWNPANLVLAPLDRFRLGKKVYPGSDVDYRVVFALKSEILETFITILDGI